MPMLWHFYTAGEAIEMQARAEGSGGMVGDAYGRIEPDSVIKEPPGLTYEALRQARAGILEIADDYKSFTIRSASTPDSKAA